MITPPLSLYIHIPWCVQKCPYCDFNSHALKNDIDEKAYVQHLLNDLEQDLPKVGHRTIDTIFIGGGTPSLFSPSAITELLKGIKARIEVNQEAEITLEANPGTVEAGKFEGFQQAGINRISIGVQSFEEQKLHILGRIHNSNEATKAVELAKVSGLNSFNLDLMHGLPQQNTQQGLTDLSKAIELSPPHLSWYQLTIEPNTLFHSKPPTLPVDDTLWDIQEQGHRLLTEAGYQQYEISAYSKPGYQCQHNLNYWRFGDYLGIGCGAHGKITDAEQGKIIRTVKVKHPKGYMEDSKRYLDKQWQVEDDDLTLEYLMNRSRLLEWAPVNEFEQRTALKSAPFIEHLRSAQTRGLIEFNDSNWRMTSQGHRFLNEFLAQFL